MLYRALKVSDQKDPSEYGKAVKQMGAEPVVNLKEARE
jgi:hypothetical protein